MSWFIAHWMDVALHLGLDLSGGLTLRCCMGFCQHRRHRYMVWVACAIVFSIMTVRLIG